MREPEWVCAHATTFSSPVQSAFYPASGAGAVAIVHTCDGGTDPRQPRCSASHLAPLNHPMSLTSLQIPTPPSIPLRGLLPIAPRKPSLNPPGYYLSNLALRPFIHPASTRAPPASSTRIPCT